MSDFFDANRKTWDNRADLHATDSTGFYRIDQVLAGGDCLHAIEGSEIGDIESRRLVHLQCHIGIDTISLASRGAVATGLDFSPKALQAARRFAEQAGRPARFVEANVYDAPAALGETYEIVFVTWGALNWLPDLDRWAKAAADLLEPGGFLYLAESHPAALCLEQIDGRIVAHYPWRTPADRPLVEDDTKTYTGDERELGHKRTYNWIHPLSDIVNALRRAGLTLEWLNEHELLPYKLFPTMEPAGSPGLFRLPEGQPKLALSFSLKAVKAG